ncbi:unnamed protein product [Phytomonas sp. EM1]|nr:unnamed protein product [Phytomonas sp. EM1]|eukprot:CCW60559.1 unnamed protein product [Phytomonas sp. isolate EM1]
MGDSLPKKYSRKSSDKQKESRLARQPFLLTREDVQAAFEFFDTQQCGHLSVSTLKARLSAFYPDLTSKEYHFLLDSVGVVKATTGTSATAGSSASSSTITMDQLWEIIDMYQGVLTSYNLEGSLLNQQIESTAASRRKSNVSNVLPAVKKNTEGNADSMAAIAAVVASTKNIDFDPVQEAFRVYDPYGTNYVDVKTLAYIMARIGFGELNDEELDILVKTADFDRDGKISFQDFRRLVEMRTERMNKN